MLLAFFLLNYFILIINYFILIINYDFDNIENIFSCISCV